MGIANDKKIELLAPAGGYEALRAVIEAGCDAVYIGGSRFGARAYADNPEEDVLLEAIDYAHLRGVSVYLTVNTLFKEGELAELPSYLRPYYERGLDAVIVQDYGVMTMVETHFPDLPIHISTQMTVTEGKVSELFSEHVTRIVPARELSIEDIRRLREETDRELEIFAHGALCYSYSGQCLMSSMIGGRSGNRGRCAQPCRKRYRCAISGEDVCTAYVLSPKDQCLLAHVHELIEARVESLKLEGRMKSPEYAAGVTAVYRKWIDRYYELGGEAYRQYLKEHKSELGEDIACLAELYNRGGFCEGYAFGRKGPEMMAMTRPNHTGIVVGKARSSNTGNGREPRRCGGEKSTKRERTVQIVYTEKIGAGDVLELRDDTTGEVLREYTIGKDADPRRYSEISLKTTSGTLSEMTVYRTRNDALLKEIGEHYCTERKAIPLQAYFTAQAGAPISLTVCGSSGEPAVTAMGPVPEAATTASATVEQVRRRLCKTGDSAFLFAECEVVLGENLFLPVSWLNELRREVLALYEREATKRYHRVSCDCPIEVERVRQQKSNLFHSICLVHTSEQAEVAVRHDFVSVVAIDTEGDWEVCLRMTAEKPRMLVLPRIDKAQTDETTERAIDRAFLDGFGIVVRTLGQLLRVKKRSEREGRSILVYTDTTLPVMNATAAQWLREKGATYTTLSPELRREEMRESSRDSILKIYGHEVLMVSEQCVRANTFGCHPEEKTLLRLIDGEGASFPVKTVCRFCYNLIYNGPTTSLLPYAKTIGSFPLSGLRLDFTVESAAETERVLDRFTAAFSGEDEKIVEEDITRGHWKRGVL